MNPIAKRVAFLQSSKMVLATFASVVFTGFHLAAQESSYLYGIFIGAEKDAVDDPTEYMNHITNAGPGWVTASVAIGANTNDTWGQDFSFLANKGHTVICRINHSYFPNGTIPLTNNYDAFASRCSNFVDHTIGCHIWTIGNELNISGEWPYDPALGKAPYVTPQNYATCFRKVYNAIKTIHPNDKVLPQAPACFAGPFSAGSNPYGTNNYPYDANPLTWSQHLNQYLTAIAATGPMDGIALHLASRGYTCDAIHSTTKFGNGLYNSFYVYKDWVSAIPSTLYSLPLYATECNGYYYWNGGHPENIFAHYEVNWIPEAYAEINRYNALAMNAGKPVFHCMNMYRWCCDPWTMRDTYYETDILNDLDIAVAQKYTWPKSYSDSLVPIGINFFDPTANVPIQSCDNAGLVPQNNWNNLTQGGGPATVTLDGSISVTWSSPGGGTHAISGQPTSPGDYALMRDYLDTSDTSSNYVTVSGIKFPLYDVIVYCDGDNGSAVRVGKYTLTTTSGTVTKYVKDDGVNFGGTYYEVDATTGGASTPAGNCCRFRNLRVSSFTIAARGDYASDGHPRGPFNGLQIVPVYSVPSLTNSISSSGQFQFTLNGATNVNYIIQASTNLAQTNWTSISTNAAPAQLNIPLGANPQRYFRAKLQ